MARYTHNCDSCVWLGEHGEYDCYWCPQLLIKMPTLVARFGSEGRDYLSLNVIAAVELKVDLASLATHPQHASLAALYYAIARARERGLIPSSSAGDSTPE